MADKGHNAKTVEVAISVSMAERDEGAKTVEA
jgi:hypothetical protein